MCSSFVDMTPQEAGGGNWKNPVTCTLAYVRHNTQCWSLIKWMIYATHSLQGYTTGTITVLVHISHTRYIGLHMRSIFSTEEWSSPVILFVYIEDHSVPVIMYETNYPPVWNRIGNHVFERTICSATQNVRPNFWRIQIECVCVKVWWESGLGC